MSNPGPMKYDDLDYTPESGEVEVRGERHSWRVPVPVSLGRAMEADGVPVIWVYAEIPAAAADLGLAGEAVFFRRLLTWPGRMIDKFLRKGAGK